MTDQTNYPIPADCNGFLWIGDPHLDSRRPGRRRDDYAQTVLDKIAQAIAIANAERLIPVFLGDLFNRHNESNLGVITSLIRILAQAWTPAIEPVGNHDVDGGDLCDTDTLMLLHESRALHVVRDSGLLGVFSCQGQPVCLGFTLHGHAIPNDVRDLAQGRRCLWLTHHDIAFPGSYPGALEPFAVLGCEQVVNGHMHAQQSDLLRGETRWSNPGNITRNSKDLYHQAPSVTVWTPDGSRRVPLRFAPPEEVFDLTGDHAAPIRPEVVQKSTFAELMRAQLHGEAQRTEDGGIMNERLLAICEARQLPPAAREILCNLRDRAVARVNK